MRFVTLLVTAAMSPTLLLAPGVSAEELGETTEPTLFTEQTEYTYNPEETTEPPVVPNTTGVTVYDSSGKAVDGVAAKADDPWAEQTVVGMDQPTLQALTKEDFAKHSAYVVSGNENLYTLTASTGISPGSTVEYFAIRYIDNSNAPQTKYLFPKVHSLTATNAYVKGALGDISAQQGSSQQDNNTVKVRTLVLRGTVLKEFSYGGTSYQTGDAFNYTLEEQPGEAAAYDRTMNELMQLSQDGYISLSTADEGETEVPVKTTSGGADLTSGKKHSTLKELGYSINEDTVTTTPLAAWSVDEYFFKTEKPITSVTGIEVFMSDGSWTVQGLSISKVKSISGYGEYGYYSGKYFLGLEKETVCNLKSKKSGTLTLPANGDTLINIGGAESQYFSLETPKSSQNSSDPFLDQVSFRIDIADDLNAGLESLLRTESGGWLSGGDFAEDLALEIEYRDKNNWTRNVTMPVLLSVIGQSMTLGDSVHTIGIAQRGDTLGFTATLPEYSSMISCKLHVGKDARTILEKNCGLTGGSAEVQNNLDNDYISIAGISVYDGTCRLSNYEQGQDAITGEMLDSYSYGVNFQSKNPALYYTTMMETGMRINAGTSMDVELTRYKDGDPLIATGVKGNFLVRIRTDDIKGAGTDGSMRVRLTYTNYDGDEHTTDYYHVKNEVMEFMGYWPTVKNREDNYGYLYGASPGKYVEFPVELGDAASVTNVELALDQFSDDLQISGVSVSVLDKIGKRRIYEKHTETENGASNFMIVRTLDHTVIPPFPLSVNLHFAPGETYSLSTGMGTTVPTSDIDYNSMRYSMTYEQTKKDLGFIRSKLIYDVTVKVADDPDANSINGDSGSKNHFYFQLLFKNGTSGVVLANQQLSADGFRAGKEEVFAIKINRDYSDVTAIRVIPEDTVEDSDVFDKLNIEKITVTERTNGGAAMQYVFNNIGWIGIDYHDKAQDGSVMGREGRSLSEVACLYRVSYQQKVVNLLCEIVARPWDVNYFKFAGSVQAELTYIDMDDQPQTIGFDVVSRMYEYAKRIPLSYEARTDGSDQNVVNSMGAVSDPETMLRPNHVDRFILPPLANAKTLKSITFYVTNRSHGTAEWVIGGLSISRIISDSGVVSIIQSGTSDSEYYRSMDVAEQCRMKTEDNGFKENDITINLPTGNEVAQTIELTGESIAWSDNSSWTSAVSRTPDSTNDTLNVYVYPIANSRNIDGVTVSAAFQYACDYSKVMQVKQNELNIWGSGTKNAMFYYTGIPAAGMSGLNYLGLSCRNSRIVFDRALVQQVRDGVIVATYDVPLNSSSAVLGLRATPNGSTRIFDKTKQTMLLSFGEATEEMSLFGPGESFTNVNDIAISFDYKSSLNDGLSQARSPVYHSPYVYLTDVGINKISPGMMAEIPFDVPYVAEITGYNIVSFGNITANVNGAVMYNYSYSDKTTDETTGVSTTVGDTRIGAYSMKDSYVLNNQITPHASSWDDIKGASGALTPIDLTIKTADADDAVESGIEVPVTITFNYINHSKSNVALPFRNSQTYIQYVMLPDTETQTYVRSEDKRFATGSEAHLRMFLPDCQELYNIEIQPVDPDGTATWKIGEIAWSMDYGTAPQTRKVDRVFDSEGGKISVRNVKMTSDVYNDGTYEGFVTMNTPKGIMVEGGKTVGIRVRIENGEGFDCKAEYIVNDLPTDVTKKLCVVSGDTISFTPLTNESTVPEVYTLTISSEDNPAVQNVINITVPAKNAASNSGQNIFIFPGDSTGTTAQSTTQSTTEAPTSGGTTQSSTGE